ncbi:rhamnogalacturonan acetylesterase [Pseudoduganella namucuonensis]|uniref:Lysophospholipase L1 n=1 Tax=Pseudoduganella namucuonensis TaxID=1035707 RepID=A0A1I7KMU6_9BURK|nr:rhamnogalacturonan acetylesterase [Pseudoduganella namucuonensis]SFU98721.1 Lysophospholipase L1 [Pseudoduganella namucuonensis]
MNHRFHPAALALLAVACAAQAQAPRKFDFSDKPAPGYTAVSPATDYTPARGYGYEVPAAGGKPSYFSVDLPEGNYNVTVTLGGAAEGSTTIKSELRRLMLENVRTAAGATATRTFTVNVRTPKIPAGATLRAGSVALKAPRETVQEAWNWDRRLTLEFNGAAPAVRTLEIAPAEVPTLFLLGDSTVSDQPGEPYASWGQMLPRFFKPGIAIANHAQSGETYRDSLARRRIDKILSAMQPGDTVLMQFGHNDQKQIKDGKGGPFTTYKAEIKAHVDAIRAHSGVPVIISPMERRRFDDQGKAGITLQDYADAARQSARELGVAFIDLHAMSVPLYQTLGPEASKAAFASTGPGHLDNTHHSNYGAYELAQAVAAGMRKAGLPAASYIADGYGAFDPVRPDPFASFAVPASPTHSNERPLGDETNQ